MPPTLKRASAAAAAPATTPAVELSGLTVRYGRREILHALTASFHGRVIGLLGPNGAGKSTLINSLLGFVRPAAGAARVLGLDVARQPQEIRRQTGYMPENDALIAPMTAVSFVRLMAELAGLPSEPALERAHEALFYVGLGEARYRKLGGYSLGMRQLAKLAQAIAHGPKLLILDEPTNSLDPPARARMLRLIREIRDTGECQILLCSHLLHDVEETCDEVVILKQGSIVHHADLAANSTDARRSQERWLEVEVVGADVPGFAAAAAARGCQLDTNVGGRLRLRLPAQLEVRDLYQLAATRGLQLRRLSFRRDTLEDIFLRAMEEGN
ncbi:MAG TPA: ABC transporter ATP-binding protein [Terriglobales bacterium]|nr:ABC transporter ATP-binding protein [Terriglobales bacterium]